MPSSILRYGVIVILVGLTLVACGGATETPAPPAASEQPPAAEAPTEEPTTPPEVTQEAAASAEPSGEVPAAGGDVPVMSAGRAYASYLAAPSEGGPYPGIVLVHSFRGLEEGYRTMVDRFAARGFVVLAVGWQTFEQSPSDNSTRQLITDSIAFLQAREDVDSERLGLTGFCAGGRYTMLFLPQFTEFKSGVAWYGFPYSGNPAPADLIDQLQVPMLMIHGTADGASPIADIYRYNDALTAAGKTVELEVYDGEPHGFMLGGGQLREDAVATNAFDRMIEFFQRTLG